MPPFPASLVVIRTGAIGDVVNALVFASAVKRHAPATRIGWVVHDLSRPLVEGHPSVDRVHLWRRGSGLAGLRAVVREVRAASYELAVDLQRIAKSGFLARASGASRVLGYDRARSKEASWLWTRERIPAGDPGAHMVEQYLEFARYLGIPEPRAEHVLPVDAAAASWAEACVARLGGAPVVVNVGATKPANRWAPERFGALAAALGAELDAPVCLTGGPADEDAGRRAAQAAAQAGAGTRVTNLVSATTLRELCALLARARLFVGCDTGPMHLAGAVGAPVVALFGPADPRRTGPFAERARVVRVPPPCAPCNRKHCNQPRHACMEDIHVEHVLDAARDLLDA